ncbi:hypothetical protein RND81_05G017700 [Saponaria officinalis]|uniref:Polymerase nucleotidyl transferase domain-containing protein n=1 Tax=Saponaria officinalis TaxID=3572 RepID=A0AAW1KTB1_SAPOF
MGDLREPNGVVLEESSYSCVSSVGQEVWARAEAATDEIIRQVQPTVVSEERRRDVVDYVHSLLKGFLGCEVFPLGSVPLKTYLPDGDIDLTAFCGFNSEEAFANEVYSVLEAQDRNPAAKFAVKDVQYIRAEVKLVKCLVQNIVVDISFNQIGGLCALGLLEEIDRLIGKDHLFKRSIILIKAWCYYESRILGAHHGLISTYALETLVLYIFHLFHSFLDGPLAVLHKFLDYFSKFDWENLCVSLSGPVPVASLPEIVAEKPETSDGELLLSNDFMRECVRKFSVPSRGPETNNKTFVQKHLNIVDPLKENNNLGRSVSKGNFFRIRSAFSYGARKLGQILSPSQENVTEEVRKFFANTLDRHGNGQRPDVQDHLPLSNCNGFNPKISLLFDERYQDQINESVFCNNISSETRESFEVTNHVVVANRFEPLHQNGSEELSGDARGFANSRIRDEFCPSLVEVKNSPSADLPGGPHLYVSHSFENGKMDNGHLDDEQHTDSCSTCSKLLGGSTHPESNGFVSCDSDREYRSTRSGETGRHESANRLPELTGDAECHLDNLHYDRWLYDQALAIPIQPVHLVPPSMFQQNVTWDPMHPTVQLRQDLVPRMNVNGVIPRPAFFPTNPTARGLGTYFPSVNNYSYRERSSPKGRHPGQLKSPRTNGRGPMPLDRNLQAQGPVCQGTRTPKCPDHHESSPRGKVCKETNGFVQAREMVVESDPPRNPSPEAETCRSPLSDPSPGSQNEEPVFVVDDNRLSAKSFRLKDDEDFPPLCA